MRLHYTSRISKIWLILWITFFSTKSVLHLAPWGFTQFEKAGTVVLFPMVLVM